MTEEFENISAMIDEIMDGATDEAKETMRLIMEQAAKLDLAEEFAQELLEEVSRGPGDNAWLHAERVAQNVMRSREYQQLNDTALEADIVTAAVLHDIVEDTDRTLREVEAVFGERVASLVDLLTHNPDVDYTDYIRTINGNPYARMIKRADMADNLATVAWDWTNQQNKYMEAMPILFRGETNV